jgi:hypothetical protein
MRWLASLAAVAACGDNLAAPRDASLPVPACTATFTGNFAATSTAPDTCATFTGDALALAVTATPLDAPLAISFSLPPSPTSGTYSSDTVATWSALATRTLDFVPCTYRAGGAVIPHGTFELALADATAPHGTLSLSLAVLVPPLTDCGAGALETVTITF